MDTSLHDHSGDLLGKKLRKIQYNVCHKLILNNTNNILIFKPNGITIVSTISSIIILTYFQNNAIITKIDVYGQCHKIIVNLILLL